MEKQNVEFQERTTYFDIWYTTHIPGSGEPNYHAELWRLENGEAKREDLFFGEIPKAQVYEKLKEANLGKLVELDADGLERFQELDYAQRAKRLAEKNQARMEDARNNPVKVDLAFMAEKMQELQYDYGYGAIEKSTYDFEVELLKTKYKVVSEEELYSAEESVETNSPSGFSKALAEMYNDRPHERHDVEFQEGKIYFGILEEPTRLPNEEKTYHAELYRLEGGVFSKEDRVMGKIPKTQVYEELKKANLGELVELDDAGLQKMAETVYKQQHLKDIQMRGEELEKASNGSLSIDEATYAEKMEDLESDYLYGAIDKELYDYQKSLMNAKYNVRTVGEGDNVKANATVGSAPRRSFSQALRDMFCNRPRERKAAAKHEKAASSQMTME